MKRPARQASWILAARLSVLATAPLNGLLLRSDVHTLFDRGYITVTPDHRVRVSRRLKADFDNGEHYYQLEGSPLWVPGSSEAQPRGDVLEWHADTVFRG